MGLIEKKTNELIENQNEVQSSQARKQTRLKY